MTPWLLLSGAMTVFVSLLGCQSSPTTNWTAETIGFTRAPQLGGTDQLWIMSADGSGQSQLSVDGDGNRSLTWSPDGNSIAFESVRDDNPEIYTASMFSTGHGTFSAHDIQRRTANPADDSSPAWSHDCALLAFSSNRANPNFYNIYQLDLNTNNVTPITTGHYEDRSPAWSPDGSKIAFTRKSSDNSREIYMHVMNSGQNVSLIEIPRGRLLVGLFLRGIPRTAVAPRCLKWTLSMPMVTEMEITSSQGQRRMPISMTRNLNTPARERPSSSFEVRRSAGKGQVMFGDSSFRTGPSWNRS